MNPSSSHPSSSHPSARQPSARRPSPQRLALSLAAATLCLALLAPRAHATVGLTDGGFEVNPLIPIGSVLGPNGLAVHAGKWADESSQIVGQMGPVIPNISRMLQMNANGGVATQVVQAIDVSSLTPNVIANGANFTFSALFNTDIRTGAIGGLAMQFFTGGDYSTQIANSFLAGNINVNSNASDWQSFSISGLIPPGTGWMLAQAYYLEASLATPIGNLPGYVDLGELSIQAVPEPSTWALAGLGLAVLGLGRRQRQTRQPQA